MGEVLSLSGPFCPQPLIEAAGQDVSGPERWLTLSTILGFLLVGARHPAFEHQASPAADTGMSWISFPLFLSGLKSLTQAKENQAGVLINSTNAANWSTPGKRSTLQAHTLDLWGVGDRGNGISSFYLMRTSCPWPARSVSTFPQTFSTKCHSPSLSPMVQSEEDKKSKSRLTRCPGSDSWGLRSPGPRGILYFPRSLTQIT